MNLRTRVNKILNCLFCFHQVLLKWGEYSNDVQFILQHSVGNTSGQSLNISSPVSPNSLHTQSPERNVDTRKSLTFSNHHRTENIGIVKGVPKQTPPSEIKHENQAQKINEDKYYVSPSSFSKVCIFRCESR